MIRSVMILIVCLMATLPTHANAHALEPGFLELVPFGHSEWRVTWRKPQVQGRPMAIDAVLPQGCVSRHRPDPVFDGRAFLTGWVASCSEGLEGGEIRIEGLERTRTDVLIRYATAQGAAPQAARLTPATPFFTVPIDPGALRILTSYFALGVDHIIKGIDHLLFLLMLLFLINDWRPLLAAVTSFTIAHSLSLAAASLGWIVVPSPPIEAIVALSIACLAAEFLQKHKETPSITKRYPWTLGFAFGLLHGLGFARALLELGLPEGDVPLALLAFNLGVEAGQILFIATAIVFGLAFARLYPMLAARVTQPVTHELRAVAYGVGSLAAYWAVERVAGFVA